jgi:hypothetical protein
MAGSPVPLLSARLKAHETFVEDALRNDDGKRRKARRKAEKRRLKMEKTKKKKHELPQGIDAFLIPGGTDDEDSGSDSDNGQDLIAKIRADMDKERRSGGGTSCGKKYRS